VAAHGFEEGLKAAAHRAAEDLAIDLDLAHTRRALDLAGGRSADEPDLDSLHRRLICHASSLGGAPRPEIREIADSFSESST
jgi:hypothetical protein